MNLGALKSGFKKIRRSIPLHMFLLGILCCLFFWFRTESAYETELFNNIQLKMKQSLPTNVSRDSFALAALHMTQYLEERRNLVFGKSNFSSIKYEYIHPATVDLMTGNGACGSYCLVLARILKSNGLPVRFGQMTVRSKAAGHIFIETKTESGWIVMDPFYDLAFVRPDGRFAGYDDLHNNWDYYKKQVPANYDSTYRYEDVRYTNWNKIPVVMPLLKKTLNLFMGKSRADKVSLRSYFLRIYDKLSWLTFFLIIGLGLRTVYLYRKRRIEGRK